MVNTNYQKSVFIIFLITYSKQCGFPIYIMQTSNVFHEKGVFNAKTREKESHVNI